METHACCYKPNRKVVLYLVVSYVDALFRKAKKNVGKPADVYSSGEMHRLNNACTEFNGTSISPFPSLSPHLFWAPKVIPEGWRRSYLRTEGNAVQEAIPQGKSDRSHPPTPFHLFQLVYTRGRTGSRAYTQVE